MSVIIRLQNLPWSANALDIRNFFRGLSIPEGGVHIVGGELGDAFIAFSTDEDARQGMMLDGGKIKEIQVKLLLSSRSEMHKVIEAARQSVPLISLPPTPAPAPPPAPAVIPSPVSAIPTPQAPPALSPFTTALGNNFSAFGIPGLGNPQEIPQPAVIEPPAPLISPPPITTPEDGEEEKLERKRSKEKDRRRSRTRSRSRSRDRDRKDRKRDRRDRSRSRDRRRRDRSRSRDRRDRKRDRKERSRSRDRSPSRRSRDRRNIDRKSPQSEKFDNNDRNASPPVAPQPPPFGNKPIIPPAPMIQNNTPIAPNMSPIEPNRFNSDLIMNDAYTKLQELGKKRNPNAFQGEPPQQQNGGRGLPHGGRGHNIARGGGSFRGRGPRYDNEPQHDCCVAIRNAPNHTSYGDVRRFFPFMIDKHGIKMINDNMGRRTGNIFVRFCDPRSKNLALQRRNNELKGAQVIVESLDDEQYESAVDSFLPYRDDNNIPDEIPIVMPVQEEVPPFTVLKLSDLPHFVKEHDLIKTFSEYSLLSITLSDCRATRTKIAHVQFAKPDDARLILERKDSILFGRRQTTITPCTDEEYEREKAIQSELSAPRARDPRERQPEPEPQLEPPPQQEPPPPVEREPTAPRDPRQRRPPFDTQGPTPASGPAVLQQSNFFGTPLVQAQQFPSPFPAGGAGPFGTGFPSGGLDPRTAAANWANRPPFPNPIGSNQMNPNQMGPNLGPIQNNRAPDLDNEPLDCVLMKGLPRDATDRTIVSFLSDTGAVPARIHLMLDSSGQPSGDCFCEFRSVQEARMAITKHGSNLDGCRITVDSVTRSVVEEALEGPKQADARAGEGLLGNGPPPPVPPFFDSANSRGGYMGRGGGGYRGRGGFDRGGFDRGGYRGGYDAGRGSYDSGRGGFDSGRGGFDSGRGGFGSSRVGFDNSRNTFESGRDFDSGRGSFRGRGGFGSDRGSRFERGRGRGFGRGRGGFDSGGRGGFDSGARVDMPPPEDNDPALEDFGAPGCVVSMENVPFRATVDEILNFFCEFELTQDDIIRRYNERGQPTGDARVAFRTPFDAQRAVSTRHLNNIHDRRINLTIL